MTETTNEKPATKADPKTYQGGCHCGQVRYEVQMYAINVRCLDGVDFSALPLSHFDGKSK